MSEDAIQITEADLHPHLRARMAQRGVSFEEVTKTLAEGWPALDAKEGTLGKVMVFSYDGEWEGQFYSQKEVSVYYKHIDSGLILLTAKARYGEGFERGK
jgi:hypothetical protein